MSFMIQHERRGIYVDDELTPRFSWAHGKEKGRRFKTLKEAMDFIRKHFEKTVGDRCVVVEK